MASEISVQMALSMLKGGVINESIGMNLPLTQFTMTANVWSGGTLSVATSATVIPLGSVTTPHWFIASNRDGTNFIRIMNGSGGAVVPKLLPTEWCCFPWDPAAVPYAIANTAACALQYLILGL